MDTDELIKKMRARVAQCRRLAGYINDPRTTETLLKMADEGEADIARLEAERRDR
jgi:ATP-dependent Zn protease